MTHDTFVRVQLVASSSLATNRSFLTHIMTYKMVSPLSFVWMVFTPEISRSRVHLKAVTSIFSYHLSTVQNVLVNTAFSLFGEINCHQAHSRGQHEYVTLWRSCWLQEHCCCCCPGGWLSPDQPTHRGHLFKKTATLIPWEHETAFRILLCGPFGMLTVWNVATLCSWRTCLSSS